MENSHPLRPTKLFSLDLAGFWGSFFFFQSLIKTPLNSTRLWLHFSSPWKIYPENTWFRAINHRCHRRSWATAFRVSCIEWRFMLFRKDLKRIWTLGSLLSSFCCLPLKILAKSQPIPAIPSNVTHSFSEMSFQQHHPHYLLQSTGCLKYRGPVGTPDLFTCFCQDIHAKNLWISGEPYSPTMPDCILNSPTLFLAILINTGHIICGRVQLQRN